MGQVPSSKSSRQAATHYLVLGSDRLARHLHHWLNLEAFPYSTWSRADGLDRLKLLVSGATHILFAVTDSAIDPLFRELRGFEGKTFVHFSGALVLPEIAGCHPLMTFSSTLYDLATYRSIPFVTEEGRAPFNTLLPGFQNSHYAIEPNLKPLYHALCVMSGTFTIQLWEKAFTDFEERLGLPKEALLPYLKQTCANLVASRTSVLTGPIARGDQATIRKNLSSLEGDAFAAVYRSFLDAHRSQVNNGGLK